MNTKEEIKFWKQAIKIIQKAYGKKPCKDFRWNCCKCRARLTIAWIKEEIELIQWIEEKNTKHFLQPINADINGIKEGTVEDWIKQPEECKHEWYGKRNFTDGIERCSKCGIKKGQPEECCNGCKHDGDPYVQGNGEDGVTVCLKCFKKPCEQPKE